MTRIRSTTTYTRSWGAYEKVLSLLLVTTLPCPAARPADVPARAVPAAARFNAAATQGMADYVRQLRVGSRVRLSAPTETRFAHADGNDADSSGHPTRARIPEPPTGSAARRRPRGARCAGDGVGPDRNWSGRGRGRRARVFVVFPRSTPMIRIDGEDVTLRSEQ